MLADARKKQQKSIEEIATELNLSVTQIRTIELDQSEGLPEATYVRGYIRSYAKLLGLNPETVLARYKNANWQKSANLDDMPRGIGSAEMADADSFFNAGKVIGVLLFAVLGAFLWYSGLLSSLFSEDEPIAKVATSRTVTSVTTSNNANNEPEIDEGQNAVESTVVAESDAESDTVSAVESEASNEGAAIASSAAKELVLTFSATSWIDIRDGDDNRLAYKSFTRGEELVIPAEGRLNVFIGNAEGVNVQYNGQPYDISGFREGVYAKFVLK